MTELVEQVLPAYSRLVEKVVFATKAADAERFLAEAFEFGRSLLRQNDVAPGDVVALHHEAIIRLARSYPEVSLASVAERLTRPMLELSMAYGLAHGMAFREHQEQLAIRERQFRTLVEQSTDNIVRYGVDARALYVNPTHERTIGLPSVAIIGKRPTEMSDDGSLAAYERAILRVAATGDPTQIEQALIAADGNLMTLQINLVAERDTEGRVIAVLALGRDISDIIYYRKKMHALAFTDVLTGLPNRALFNERIRQEQAEAAHEGTRFGLMLLDLDDFKTINDTLGHAVGDRLLQQAARRLQNGVRTTDVVARLGGDEFVVILPKVRDAQVLGRIASQMMKALTEPYHIDRHELFVSASIGIAVYPTDSEDVEALLKYADSAMYHAKAKGRNNFQHYSHEHTIFFNERMALEAALRKAIERDELELYYQPQVEVANGCIVGAEALLRWNRKEGGMVPPDVFIPLAEETGLIVAIGEWVLTEASAAAAAWNAIAGPLRVAVNLSTRQFVKNDLVATLERVLAETACLADWLELEITESLLLEDSADVQAKLERLAKSGFLIAIDDFGTGYSALSYLNRFPVSVIKIDRSFVIDIPDNRDRAELVKALISIAEALRLELVAEGVETQRQAEYLLAHGCRVAQGYLYGKPMPRAAFEARLLLERKGSGTVPDAHARCSDAGLTALGVEA